MTMAHNETIFSDPVIWVATAFVIFMIGFIKLALPHILRGLDNRSQTIAKELESARLLREEAQALLKEYQDKKQAAEAEAEALLAHAKQEAQALRAQAEETLKSVIERRTKLAHEKIARAESDAVEAIKRSVVARAIADARQLAEEHAAHQQDAMIEQALSDIGQLVH